MRIALIGDQSEVVAAHQAIPLALNLEARHLGVEIRFDWLGTADLDDPAILKAYDGGWAVPGSPYVDFDNALAAIRVLREGGTPFLGTCGGYQHALVEYARNVLGHAEAGITEIDPECSMPVVSALVCALIDETQPVLPEPRGLINALCGEGALAETYRCSFGLNPDYEDLFLGGGFDVAARDGEGAIRAMSLGGHPFFLGCAFQPERAAFEGCRHPIIAGFVATAAAQDRYRQT